MRHVIILPALFLCCSCLYAQQFGLTLGVDIPKDSFAEGAMRGGITGGLACRIRATDGFNIRAELLYARRSMIYTTHFAQLQVVGNEGPASAQTDITLHYVELPLLASLVVVQGESFELSLDLGMYAAGVIATSAYTPPEFGFTVNAGKTSPELGALVGIGTTFSIGGGQFGVDLRYRVAASPAVQEIERRYQFFNVEHVYRYANEQSMSSLTLAASFFF